MRAGTRQPVNSVLSAVRAPINGPAFIGSNDHVHSSTRSRHGLCLRLFTLVVGCSSRARVADADWLTYNRTLAKDRFTPLKEIDRSNVAQLKAISTYTLPELSALQTAPLFVDVTMYFTTDEGLMRSMCPHARRSGNSIGTAIRQALCS